MLDFLPTVGDYEEGKNKDDVYHVSNLEGLFTFENEYFSTKNVHTR